MIPSKTLQLGTDVFVIPAMLGEETFIFQSRIAPLVAEIIALFAAREESDSVAGLLEQAGPVVARAAQKLPPEELRAIMRILLKSTTMNGKELYSASGQGNAIDVLMQGRAIDIWKLIYGAIEVSYPDFFGLARGFLASAKAKGDSATSTTSVHGSAGGSG